MTFGEFYELYKNPNNVTNEQTEEGTYYTHSIFSSFPRRTQAKVAIFVSVCKDVFLLERQNFDAANPIWLRAVLSILALAVNQCIEEKTLEANTTIERQDCPFSIGVDTISAFP